MSCETCDTPGESMCGPCADVAREVWLERDRLLAVVAEARRIVESDMPYRAPEQFGECFAALVAALRKAGEP